MPRFTAANGVTVQFRARYQDATYYAITPPHEATAELTVFDDGRMRIFCDAPIPATWHMAYAEFKTHERQQYEQWRVANAHLFN